MTDNRPAIYGITAGHALPSPSKIDISCQALRQSQKTSIQTMKASVFMCTAVAVATLSSMGGECIQSIPKWVDDAKLAYAVEIKSPLATPMAPKLDDSVFTEVPAPVDVTALTAELARLEESEEKFRGDRRAIAFFATLLMVGVFLVFYFTTTRVEESIKEASKLLGAASRPEAVDLRL
ncbi:hypothetical protein Esti_003196 [Eimeria stiedai]